MSDTPLFDETNDDMIRAKRDEQWRAEVAKMELNEAYGKYPVTDSYVTDPAPQPKVVFATVGSGVGVALATITVWGFEAATAVDVPEGVELAFGVVLTAALTFVAGYFKRD